MQPFEIVRIKISKRDGRFYISSDDVPGLWLWGNDLARLLKNIAPAIQYLYKYNRGIEVEVEGPTISKFLLFIFGWMRLFKSLRESYKIYSSGNQKLTSAHG